MFNTQLRKGLAFCMSIILLFSLQFIYIGISTVIGKTPIQEVGSPLFLMYVVYDFGLHMFYFIVILTYGAKANVIDGKIMNTLMKIAKKLREVQILVVQKQVFLLKNEDNTFK